MTHALGIDVGGTFTDFVAYDREKQKIEVWKELSTPTDPVVGIIGGLGRYRRNDEAVEHMRLGTTVATNAILERKGATVAYVTTKGFKDVIFIQRGNRKYHYDMSWVKPKPLGQAPALLRAGRADRCLWRCAEGAGRRGSAGAGSTDPGDAGDRRGRGLHAVLLPEPGARASDQGDPDRGAA